MRSMMVQVVVAKESELLCRTELDIFSTAMGSTRQSIYKCAGTPPSAQALHRFRQKLLLQSAACPLKKLVDSGFILVNQPASKSGHNAFSIDGPIKAVHLYNHLFELFHCFTFVCPTSHIESVVTFQVPDACRLQRRARRKEGIWGPPRPRQEDCVPLHPLLVILTRL